VYGEWSKIAQIIICEICASMVFVFFFLTQTEEKTQLSKDRAICCFIVAASYVGARSLCGGPFLTYSGAVLNPAIGIGACILEIPQGLSQIWVYGCLPFGGAVLAMIFHELIFKKT